MIVFTGGSGKLGTEMKKFFPDALFPTRDELDITSAYSIIYYFNLFKPTLIVHCAAFTSPPVCDKNPVQAIRTNIQGTAYIAEYALQKNIPVVYISTEYVFDGSKGNYKEDDPVHPVNIYGWTKLAGECAIRALPEYLIVRCAFVPEKFPFDKAPIDQYSSRDTVSCIASQLAALIDKNARGVYHIGTERKSVWEMAQRTSEEYIEQCSIENFNFAVPKDASLDTSKFKALEEE